MSFFDFDEIYRDQFDRTIQSLHSTLTGDIQRDIATLQATIKTLWDDQANDWTGRGDLYLTRNQASIAAAEQILQELKAD